MIRPVVNVFYFVADLRAGIDWYRDLLDTEPVETRSQLAMFEVGDVDGVVAHCVQRGGVAHRGPKTIFSGERLCQVLDPFGNLIGFRQSPSAG